MGDLSEQFASMNVERMEFQSRKNPVPKNKHPRMMPVSARGSSIDWEEEEESPEPAPPPAERKEDTPLVSARAAETENKEEEENKKEGDNTNTTYLVIGGVVLAGIVAIIAFYLLAKTKYPKMFRGEEERKSRGEVVSSNPSSVSRRAVDNLIEYTM